MLSAPTAITVGMDDPKQPQSDGVAGSKQSRNSLKPWEFHKGKSGNPGGRPKEVAEVRDLARAHTVEAINKLATHMRGKDPRVSVAAAQVLLDRAWGKAPQAITDADGGALVIQVVRFGDANN